MNRRLFLDGRSLYLSLVLLSATFSGCQRTQVAEYREVLSLRLEHTPVAKHVGPGEAKIRALLVSSFDLDDEGIRVVYRIQGEDFQSVVMGPGGQDNEYIGSIPAQPRGTQVEYYIQVRSLTGSTITLPKKAIQTGAAFPLTFTGNVPLAISFIHRGSILIGLILILTAGYMAFLYLKTRKRIRILATLSLAGTIFLFMGGIPLHIMVNYQTLGSVWEGIPVGTNRTDSLTLLLLTFWIVVMTLFKGTLFQGEEEKNIVSARTFARLVLIGALFTLIVFLLPG
jgi:hypothetical protein